MNYSKIKKIDVADGPGVRVGLFVSGCTHRCRECFNPETWDFNFGQKFTSDTIDEIISALAPDYITGFTLLGGEPFERENQPALLPLLQRIKNTYPQKTVWCYSGYLFDGDIINPESKIRTEATNEMISLIDVLVDGEFHLDEKDLNIKFRGSRNQRIIDVARSLKENRVITLSDDQV